MKEFLDCCRDSVCTNVEKFYFMSKCDNGLEYHVHCQKSVPVSSYNCMHATVFD